MDGILQWRREQRAGEYRVRRRASGRGGNPTLTATAAPAATTTGSRLQDTALLASTESLQGTGSITFNLYGPGDTTCATIIHTETVSSIASDGPFGTSAGFVATLAGTYNWTASFTGDADNASATSCATQIPSWSRSRRAARSPRQVRPAPNSRTGPRLPLGTSGIREGRQGHIHKPWLLRLLAQGDVDGWRSDGGHYAIHQ